MNVVLREKVNIRSLVRFFKYLKGLNFEGFVYPIIVSYPLSEDLSINLSFRSVLYCLNLLKKKSLRPTFLGTMVLPVILFR